MGEVIQQFNEQGRRTDSLKDGAVQKLTQGQVVEARTAVLAWRSEMPAGERRVGDGADKTQHSRRRLGTA